jgi:hypothetical protein
MPDSKATDEAIRLAASRGLRFDVNERGLVVLGDSATLAELHDYLGMHLSEIRELIGDHITAAKSGNEVSAAALLRFGLWTPTNPHACKFYVGETKFCCRRCGATWQTHLELQGLARNEPAYSKWIAQNMRTSDDVQDPE